ncbi:uncharacterized protein LOC112089182 [Eutrema salsugineum]|uniref:uncharacterized protein LOC112089182 n=1 Tax=Eutrema salsugineum TaxID=72664 RepID=UPI000CED28F8|nr:uncharacterized protein LOC112089182 [Eutrema salsugineum]
MEINAKVDTMYNDLNGKYEAVWTHVKKLDVQVAQTAEAVKRSPGTLPGKGENPRNEFVNAIELKSGKTLHAAPTSSVSEKRKKKDVEHLLQEEEPAHDVKKTKEHSSSIGAPAPKSGAPAPDVDLTREHPEPTREHLLQPPAPANIPARVYTPKVPYPVPQKKSRKDLEDAKCREMLKDLTVKLPLADAVKMIPALKRYMKGLVSGKAVEEESVMMVSKECSAVLQKREVIQEAKRLGYTRFKPTKISLVFADRSTKFPVGILEDLHVQIGDTLIPADFVVLELDEEPKDPLILGRSFLCTAGAIIDVKEGVIDLQLGDMVVRFEMNKLFKKPMLDGQTFVIDDGSGIAEEVAEEVLAIDPLEVALTKAEGEHGYLSEEADGFAKMLNASTRMQRQVDTIRGDQL